MGQIVAIAGGGMAGALARFWMANGVYSLLGRGFPWGTLVVNVLGSFVIGLLYVLLIERLNVAAEWRGALIVGFLGSFTTFSSFSLETVQLLEDRAWVKAIVNVVASTLLCLVATVIGIILARRI